MVIRFGGLVRRTGQRWSLARGGFTVLRTFRRAIGESLHAVLFPECYAMLCYAMFIYLRLYILHMLQILQSFQVTTLCNAMLCYVHLFRA